MSAIWRNWRKENWKSCRSGWEDEKICRDSLGGVRCLLKALILGYNLQSPESFESAIRENNFIVKSS